MDDEHIKILSEQKFAEAIAYHRSGQIEKALSTYSEVLQHNPLKFEAYANLGLIYRNQQDIPQAIFHFEKAAQIKTDDPNILFNLGVLYQLKEKNVEAENYLKKVLSLNSKDWQAALILGKLLQKTHRYIEALKYYYLTVNSNSTSVEAYTGLGIIYRENNNLTEALRFFQEAVNHDPDNPRMHTLLMEAQLYSGNLYDGFIEHEWRKKLEMKDYYEKFMALPQWQGEIFSGKRLLIHCEQGLGDTLQFVRYMPLVKMRGGSVTLACQQPLLRVLKKMEGVDAVVNTCNLQDFDLCVSLMSLPVIFGTTLNTIPNSVPYIKLDPAIVNAWEKQILANGLYKIGLVWSGKSNIKLSRPFRLLDFSPLANVKNVALYSLQKSEEAEQIKELSPEFRITDLTNNIDDFADTAGAIMTLDLVISIDTSVAHLAGALGKPTWIVLSHNSEWRWLAERKDSPWYPTIRLYRQEKEGDWNSVFVRMAGDLDELVNNVDKFR